MTTAIKAPHKGHGSGTQSAPSTTQTYREAPHVDPAFAQTVSYLEPNVAPGLQSLSTEKQAVQSW